MEITNSGNVGIGTGSNSPTEKLEVNGAIHVLGGIGDKIYLNNDKSCKFKFNSDDTAEFYVGKQGIAGGSYKWFSKSKDNTDTDIERLELTDDGHLWIKNSGRLEIGAQSLTEELLKKINDGTINKGDTGDRGPQGEQGSRGPQGVQGIQGATGATGERGPSIFAGTYDDTLHANYKQGDIVQAADTGYLYTVVRDNPGSGALTANADFVSLLGPKGDTGETGLKGETGDSAFKTWQQVKRANGASDRDIADKNQFIADLKGDKGNQGPKGDPGEDGATADEVEALLVVNEPFKQGVAAAVSLTTRNIQEFGNVNPSDTLKDGQVLTYDASTMKWINRYPSLYTDRDVKRVLDNEYQKIIKTSKYLEFRKTEKTNRHEIKLDDKGQKDLAKKLENTDEETVEKETPQIKTAAKTSSRISNERTRDAEVDSDSGNILHLSDKFWEEFNAHRDIWKVVPGDLAQMYLNPTILKVGIGKKPDPDFALDVNGVIRGQALWLGDTQLSGKRFEYIKDLDGDIMLYLNKISDENIDSRPIRSSNNFVQIGRAHV